MSYIFNPFSGTFDATSSGSFIPTSEKGAPLGVATLDGGGKVPVSQLPNSVMEFKGVFDPATATFTDASGNAGDVWQATAAGSYDAGSGAITFAIGDWAVHNGSIFQKSLNSNAVASVNGFTGVVILDTDDISEGVTNLYFTDARARTAVVDDSITDGITNKAPSQNAVFDALALKADTDLSNLTNTIAIPDGVHLLPANTNQVNLGSATKSFEDAFIFNLKDNAGAVAFNVPNRILYDSSGNESIRYNDRLMYDNTNTASIDYDGRSLRDPSGNSVVAWNSGQYITFYPNGGIPRILEFFDGNFSNTVQIRPPTNVLVDYTLTLPNTASGSANSVVLEDGSGGLSFSTNLKDTSNIQSVLYSSRELTDSTGSEVALNWDTRVLSDVNSGPAIDFSSATDIVVSKNIDFDANGTLNVGSSTNNANVLWTRNIESNSYLGLYADLNNIELGSNAEEVKIITWNGTVAPTLKLQDSNNFDVGIKAPDVLSASYLLTLPPDDGASGQVLTTDGSGVLSWTTPTVGANQQLSNLSGTTAIPNGVHLLPANNLQVNLGSSTNKFNQIYGNTVYTSGVSAPSGTIYIESSLGDIDFYSSNENINLYSYNAVASPTLKFWNDLGTNSINLKAPTGAFATTTYTLPVDGTNGQVLSTNGSGLLSWTTPSAPTNTANRGAFFGTSGALTVNNGFLVTEASMSYALSRINAGTVTSTGSGAVVLGYADSGTLSATNSGSVTQGYASSTSTITSTGVGSLARGSANTGTITASGQGSFASGATWTTAALTAGGMGSIAAGFSLGASSSLSTTGTGTFALGYTSNAGAISTGAGAGGGIATGYATDAGSTISISGTAAFARGFAGGGADILASGSAAFASGHATNAKAITSSGIASVATGYALNFNIEATGNGSLAGGYANNDRNLTASGLGSLSYGNANQTSSDYGTTFGLGNNNSSYSSLVIGRYSDSTGFTPASWVSSEPVFLIGNGASNASRSNAFRIDKDGTVYMTGPSLAGATNGDVWTLIDNVTGEGEWKTPGAGSGADLQLSNLTGATAIPVDLIFNTISNAKVKTADAAGASPSNDIYLNSGDQSGTSYSGSVWIGSGYASGGSSTGSGGVSIFTGNSDDAISGILSLYTGTCLNSPSGNMNLSTGQGTTGAGNIVVTTGNTTASGASGTIAIATGDSIVNNEGSGTLTINTGSALGTAASGVVNIKSGDGETYSGDVSILTGEATVGAATSGSLYLQTGGAGDTGGITGSINIISGSADVTSGNINLTTGPANTTRGEISLNSLQVNVNSTNIVNVLDPSSPQDAATKNYVDTLNNNKKEQFTLSAGDITNGYVDLLNVAKTDSIDFVFSGLVSTEGTDYTVNYTGGAGSKTRITFTGHTPTLVAGDVINIKYQF